VDELPQSASAGDIAEVHVGFGANEVVGRDVDGHVQTVNSVGNARAESTANAQKTTAR
jgi:hypothetical protein